MIWSTGEHSQPIEISRKCPVVMGLIDLRLSVDSIVSSRQQHWMFKIIIYRCLSHYKCSGRWIPFCCLFPLNRFHLSLDLVLFCLPFTWFDENLICEVASWSYRSSFVRWECVAVNWITLVLFVLCALIHIRFMRLNYMTAPAFKFCRWIASVRLEIIVVDVVAKC